MGAEFLQHSYAPYGVKDEPLRTDYYSAYAAYGAEGIFKNRIFILWKSTKLFVKDYKVKIKHNMNKYNKPMMFICIGIWEYTIYGDKG